MKFQLLRYPSITKFCQPSFNTYLYEFTYKYIILVNWFSTCNFFIMTAFYIVFCFCIIFSLPTNSFSLLFPHITNGNNSVCIFQNFLHAYIIIFIHMKFLWSFLNRILAFLHFCIHHLSIHMVYISVNIFEYINIILSGHNFLNSLCNKICLFIISL